MADAGSIGIYRAAYVRQSLAVWTASDRTATSFLRPVSLRQSLSVWAAGSRETSRTYRRLPWRMRLANYVGGSASLHTLSHHGRLAGTVLVNNEPQADKLVVLIYRATFKVVDATRSAADGTWEFTELYEPGQYLVLAFDALHSAPDYNALVADYLTPVNP